MKDYIKEPIPEILAAWQSMSAAVDAHLSGDYPRAKALFAEANDRKVWHWLDQAWIGVHKHVVHKKPPNDTREIPKEDRDPDRNISPAVRAAVLKRDGYRCRYCGLPVVDAEIRRIARALYPTAVPWNSKVPEDKHAGFQALWLQYDHVEPHSHGGRSTEDNVVITCAVCNFGKDKHTLRQLELNDPRDRPPVPSDFDGLERLRVVGRPRKLKSCEERLSDRECLRVLAAFAPKFLDPDASFGEWVPAQGSGDDGDFIQLGYFRTSALFDEFHAAMYQWGWVSNEFSYQEWRQTPAAKAYLTSPRTIASADVDDLVRITTVLVRGEKWMEGSLAENLENGILAAVAGQAEGLLHEEEPIAGKLGHYAMP